MCSSDLAPTVSIGVCGHATQATLAETIASADEALYQAKNTGRDRAVVFNGSDFISVLAA